jgi:hypothetical protein
MGGLGFRSNCCNCQASRARMILAGATPRALGEAYVLALRSFIAVYRPVRVRGIGCPSS